MEKEILEQLKQLQADGKVLKGRVKLVEEHNIDFPYKTIKEYIIQTYEEGEEIYLRLSERYKEEILYYSQKDKSFEDMFGSFEL